MPPGWHAFSATYLSGKRPALEKLRFELEAGKTYYIQLVVKSVFIGERLNVTEITKNSADRLLPDLVLDTDCGINAHPNLK